MLKFPRHNGIFAVPTLLIAMLGFPGDSLAQESPGTIRHSFAIPAGFSNHKSRWTFDNTLGRYYFTSLDAILVADREGNTIKSWSIAEAENRDAFNAAHGSVDDGALFFENESTFHLLAADRTTMTAWNFVDLNDGNGEISLSNTFDFSPVLPDAGATAIDRGPDGSWWIISDGSIYNINETGTAIRRSITPEELGDKLVGSGALQLREDLIAVDRISGDIFVNSTSSQNAFHLRDRFYRIDQQSLLQEGRFEMSYGQYIGAEFSTRARIVGATDGFVMLRQFSPPVLELGLEPQDLPDMTSFSLDQEGVLWTYCYSFFRQVEVTMGVNWGADAGPGRVYDSAPVSIGDSPAIVDSGPVKFSFPRSNLVDLPPFFEDLILLLNDKDQLSTPIPITLPVASYNGPVMFGQVCPDIASFDEVIANKKVTWTWSGVAPKEPFNGWVEFADYVPWVGGKRYGIKDIQATGKAIVSSKDEGSVSVAGGGAFLLGPGKLRTEFGGGVLQSLKPEGPEVTGGLLTMKVAGSVSQEAGLIEVFPQLAPLKTVALIGSAMTWLDKRAKLTATIGLGLDSSTKVKLSEENDILFDGQITGFLELGVAAAVSLINGYAEVSAYGQGKGSVTLIPSSAGLTVDNIAITALVGAKIRAYLLERSVQRVVSISSKDGVVVSRDLPNDGFVSDTGWQYAYADENGKGVRALEVMPHVLTKNPFAEFDQIAARGTRATGKAPIDSEVRVLGGIPSDATLNATSSPRDNKMMVVWTQPIPGNPSTQATDVWFSYFDGSAFSPPAPIFSDARADFNPKIAFHTTSSFPGTDEVWIAAWERNGVEEAMPTGSPEADTETLLANLRPCWAWFDPVTRKWSEPQELPISGSNGFNVQLMNCGSGRLAGVAWLESDSGNMYPWDLNAADPSQGRIGGIRLRYQQLVYRPGENEVVAIGDLRTLGDEDPEAGIPDDIVEYSIGIDQRIGGAVETVILITRLMDVKSVNPFETNMRIESWGEPGFGFVGGLVTERKSMEDVDIASNPQVHIKQNVRTTGIVAGSRFRLGSHQQGGGTPPIPIRGINPGYEHVEFEADDPFRPQAAEFQSYSLVDLPDPDGIGAGKENNPPRAVIVQRPDAAGNFKLHMAGSLRRIGPITYGSSTDRHANAVLASDGTLLTMYQQVPINKTETTTAKVLGTREEEPLLEITEESLGFFTISRRLIVTNLAAGNVRLRSGFLKEGETVTLEVEVRNTGDNLVESPKVSLYAVPVGSTGDEVVEILENESAGPSEFYNIFGNETLIKSVDWIVPDNRAYNFFVVVDPENAIDEYDEDDNMSESHIINGIPSGVLERLLGRLSGNPVGLDKNQDGIVDSADIQ